MGKIHMTDAEVARDWAGVLTKVREGDEVVVEHDHYPVAIIKSPESPGRKLSDCIQLAQEYERMLGVPLLDEDFAADVQAGIAARSDTLTPSTWE